MTMEFMRGEATCPWHDTEGEYVARGNDSRVVRVRGKIHKIYDQDLLAFMLGKEKVSSQVSFYMGAQNTASKLAELEDWQISLPYLNKYFPLRVLCFEEGQICTDCNVVTGVQTEIPGLHLEDDPNFPDKEKLEEALEVTGDWMGRRLNLNGIYLSMNNVKNYMGIFVVTDMASVVAAVKPI